MNKRSNRFSPEVREGAVRMVREHRGECPRRVPVAVAAVDALGALLVIAGAAAGFNIEFHEALGHELHHLAQHVDFGSLLGELG